MAEDEEKLMCISEEEGGGCEKETEPGDQSKIYLVVYPDGSKSAICLSCIKTNDFPKKTKVYEIGSEVTRVVLKGK